MKINVVKVGNDFRPASDDDIRNIEERLKDVVESNRNGDEVTLVTHHAIEHEIWEIDESNKGNETLNQETEEVEIILSPADLLEI